MRLLSICPRVRKESGRLVATTAWRLRLLTVGMVYRRIVVDPDSKTITIFRSLLWFLRRTRKIPFSHIDAVTYGYVDFSPASFLAYAHDSFDWFTVGLRETDNSEMKLFDFIGDGTFGNDGPLPDWLYWHRFAFDVSGSQENESLLFAEALAAIMEVKIVSPRLY